MSAPPTLDTAAERRQSSLLLDVLIRAGLVFALAALCYRIFAPFLTLMVWALILAVAMYPLHQMLARRVGGKQGLAATLIALTGAILIVAPTAVQPISNARSTDVNMVWSGCCGRLKSSLWLSLSIIGILCAYLRAIEPNTP